MEQRIAALCGQPFIEQALYIESENDDYKLSGWLGLPTYSRSQSDLQYIFVNGRPVRDKTISHAMRRAYSDLTYHGRQPCYILYLSLPTDKFDVNVHPTKSEVRFKILILFTDTSSQKFQTYYLRRLGMIKMITTMLYLKE